MVSELTKVIRLSPAYDKRNADPEKNYGIHGVTLGMYLAGPEGAIQFVLFTNWQLPHVQIEIDQRRSYDHTLCHPMPADLGYHSKISRYEGQAPIEQDCEWTGGVCYYDGSGLNADRIYQVLLVEGDAGVWRELEVEYQARFSGGQSDECR